MIRRAIVTWCVCMATIALPLHADAQQAAFVQALSELTTAIEGTFGDEGARLRSALDRMSAALATWDRDIEAAESGVRDAVRHDTPARAFERRVSLGRMYADRGRLADALSQFDAAGGLAPTRADVHVLRGLALRASGRPAETIEAFRTARALDPADPVIAYYLFHEATISGRADDAQEAVEALAAAYPNLLKAEPQSKRAPFAGVTLLHGAGPPVLPPAAYRPAFADLARGDYDRALAALRTAAAGDPLVTDPAAGFEWMTRAVGALQQGRLAAARSLIEQAGPPRESSEAHRVLGLIYWADADYDRSIAALTAAISLSPRDERTRLALARVLNAAGRDAAAERALHDTIRALPESALAHWWLALAYERVNRLADARRELEYVTAAAVSGEQHLYASIGRFALGAADGTGAIDAFARAVRADPNDPAMHRVLAGALIQQDRVAEAFAEYVAALLIDPRDAEAHAGVGRIHLHAGRDADAASALQRATDLAPANIETRFALASALERLGRASEAAAHFTRVEQAQRRMLDDRRRALSADVLAEEAALRAAEGQFETAIDLYEQALAAGASSTVYGQLADLYSKVGRAADAARARALRDTALPRDRADGSPAR